jgi:hypothetical protein
MPDKNRTRKPDETTRRPDTENGVEQDRWRDETDEEGRRFGGTEDEGFTERQREEGDRENEGERGRTPRHNPPLKDR